ncbi:MAG: DNA-directed RNA polymerase subunit beta [Gammaproteobacteria bacterium AqS3]|nr:DNA-directed RNA polymerase subunit beta [Gammaproteobacteria bacterium AqS3]
MGISLVEKKRVRKSFSKRQSASVIPDFLSIQLRSYEKFLQRGMSNSERKDMGLHEVLKDIFPLNNQKGTVLLEYQSYDFGPAHFGVDESLMRGATYAAPLRVKMRMVFKDRENPKKIKETVTEDVYLGDFPMMTERGSFVINGTERVVVSQLQRSPGVVFTHVKGTQTGAGNALYQARVIPSRGVWLEFEFDNKDLLHVRLDRRRKIPVTTLLHALGYTRQDIFERFCTSYRCEVGGNPDVLMLHIDPSDDADDSDEDASGDVLNEGRGLAAQKRRNPGASQVEVPVDELLGSVLARDLIDQKSGEVIAECNSRLSEHLCGQLSEGTELHLLDVENDPVASCLSNTMEVKITAGTDPDIPPQPHALADCLRYIFQIMDPGGPGVSLDVARKRFQDMFGDSARYDLSRVGRMKFNLRTAKYRNAHGLPENEDPLLHGDDIIAVLGVLLDIYMGKEVVDDIDSLGNRRIRTVGELVAEQFRNGMVRIERVVRERLGSIDIEKLSISDIINAKPVGSALMEFFGGSQLSQFMDQVNPLSEIAHKRRISALGASGLTRDRAGFEVRDVHPTHYGKLCPVETPEGPNIGLINSLACYARVNEYGFLETPYRRVVDGVVTKEIEYISGIDEFRYIIAQANAQQDSDGRLLQDFIEVRIGSEFAMRPRDQVQYMDVAPQQIVSTSAALIPFLEHDDANRVLMGANMQRQAVPSLRAEKPLVGTGMERKVASDSRVCEIAKRPGVVETATSGRIVVRVDEDAISTDDGHAVDIYRLTKYQRSNQNTCITQQPIVKEGDRVAAGDILADGPSVDMGELALGQNIRIAFMPWHGYNFEDSILVSERVARDDRFTNIHIQELTCYARETKLGDEEITSDLPNVSDEALSTLDTSGIVYYGAEIKEGDILVGKVSPKGETVLSPEERLLHTIFGEKAVDVRDTSLRVPSGIQGMVIDVQVFTRDEEQRDERSTEIEASQIDALQKDTDDELRIIRQATWRRLSDLLIGKVVAKSAGLTEGDELTAEACAAFTDSDWKSLKMKKEADHKILDESRRVLRERERNIKEEVEAKIQRIQGNDVMQSGVLKMVKVYIASKRRIQPGDKMAGRHGNKGVVSLVLPEEDMPFDEDGNPIDIVLNPLGVPSRMNIGQILETHLGWAAVGLGRKIEELLAGREREKKLRDFLGKIYRIVNDDDGEIASLSDSELLELAGNYTDGVPFATPVFDGADEKKIKQLLKLAGLPESGQTWLYDGRTGERFHRPVTVGYMYMLKLNHLVDDKMHARSVGPYTLITQQPLGGKAQFGGQRLGEMEVWALEAYGAAHTLQEMLTVKSDDVTGRNEIYKSIVRGENRVEARLPESFNVLVKEIRSLGISIEAETENQFTGETGL